MMLDTILSQVGKKEQDWLYKLDLSKLSVYSLKWNDVKNGDFSSLDALYDAYAEMAH